MHQLWSLILQIGSVSGLLALALNLVQGIKKTPCFKYEFQGGSRKMLDENGQLLEENGLKVCIERFSAPIFAGGKSTNSF